MSTKTIIRCDACSKTAEVDYRGPRTLPEGWISLQMSRSVGGGYGAAPATVVHACSERCVGFDTQKGTALHVLYRQAIDASEPARGPLTTGEEPS